MGKMSGSLYEGHIDVGKCRHEAGSVDSPERSEQKQLTGGRHALCELLGRRTADVNHRE